MATLQRPELVDMTIDANLGREICLVGDRDKWLAYVESILVCRRKLNEHVRLLQKLMAGLHRLGRFTEGLPVEVHEKIVNKGIRWLPNDRLAYVILNASGLFGLYQWIDETIPQAWMPMMEEAGRKLLAGQGKSVPPG